MGCNLIGNISKAKREFGFDPRPVSKGWVKTVRREMRPAAGA